MLELKNVKLLNNTKHINHYKRKKAPEWSVANNRKMAGNALAWVPNFVVRLYFSLCLLCYKNKLYINIKLIGSDAKNYKKHKFTM
jgi:hypothetical protein